ncbi:MAG: PD-(D/E)XK nuclease family protein [Clostridiales bacterium]|nr:PD-(D/E)XK nuclease family protein [Clostridiales bacterium]
MDKMKQKQFASYPQALKALARELNKREFSPDEYYVVLCPDRYTLAVEQALFCQGDGKGGALDLEVLTLSRLSRRVAPAAKTLSKEGGVMITARAIAATKNEFGYYTRAAAFDDFAREAYTTLQQITASDARISEIDAQGSVKVKLNDLALIQADYEKIKGEYSDAPDKLFALIENADGKFIKNTRFFAIGYADMTKLIARVFSVLAEHAKAFTLYTAPPRDTKRESLDLLCAPDKISEYKQVAAEIRDYVYRGGRYEDVAIICTSPRALNRILGEYQIPAYTDESKPLFATPPLAVIDNVYKLYTAYKKRNAIDCTALVALAKNPYVGCDALDAETLLYEVSTRALGYVPLDYEFKGGARAASRVLAVLREFEGGADFGTAVENVVKKCDFASVQSATSNGTDIVTPIFHLVELLRRYGSGDFDIDAKAFFGAAAAVNVNTLPRERDCVTVTVPSSLRMTAVKKLFITDFNEGVMPMTIADTGLITDTELNMLGGVIEPTVRGRNKQSRDELKAVVVNADSVYAAYSAADGSPAAFIRELAKNINTLDYSEICETLLLSSDERFISKQASVPAAAREVVARRMSAYADSIDGGTEKTAAYYAPHCDRIDITHKPTLSVSELSHWFSCPYYRFLHDSVCLAERRGGFGAPDFGIVVHDFMRRFVAQQPYDCSPEAVKKIIDEVLAESEIQPDDATYSRMLADAVDYAVENARILEKGEYEVGETEYRFGGKTLGAKAKFEFIGFIDRFDLCDDRARIIDYKTGNKQFDIDKCIDGTDMQLPLYAYALPYDVTGMFYVRTPKRYYTKTRERAMSGCMVADVDVAMEYDTDLIEGGPASDIIPARLTVNKDDEVVFSRRNKALLDKPVFDALIERCKLNADVAADEIADGYVCRSPIGEACTYCPYAGICGGGEPRDFDYDTDLLGNGGEVK